MGDILAYAIIVLAGLTIIDGGSFIGIGGGSRGRSRRGRSGGRGRGGGGYGGYGDF